MDEKIFDFMVELEDDLIVVYQKLKNISRFDTMKLLFELMIKQSSGHSLRIRNIDVAPKPEFNTPAALELHNRIKEHLFDETVGEKSYDAALRKLANSEELIGKMYQSIAQYYQKVSEYYQSISKKVEELAHEEYGHRDAILNGANQQKK